MLTPSAIAHQDLGALLASQPDVSQRWRAHVMASPFGSVQVAGFNFPRPIGTAIPELKIQLASLTTEFDERPSIDLGDIPVPQSRPQTFPEVNRRLKGDKLIVRQPGVQTTPIVSPEGPTPGRVKTVSFPKPAASPVEAESERPVSDIPLADIPAGETTEVDLQAALAADGVEVMTPTDDVAALNPDLDPIDDPDPAVRLARLYFGSDPISEALSPIEPWPAGEEPVMVMPPAADLQGRPLAAAPVPAVAATLPLAAETVVPKGPVPPLEKRATSPAERLRLNVAQRQRAEKCLAEAVYFEARGEPVRGQVAVAQVVMNRVFSGFYPSHVCGVVYQNAHRHLACQFTFACDNVKDVIREEDLWARAKQIARDTLDGKLWLPEIGKATHYHASFVSPWWVRSMRRHAKIGEHLFYRPRRWGNGADAPSWGPGPSSPTTASAAAPARL